MPARTLEELVQGQSTQVGLVASLFGPPAINTPILEICEGYFDRYGQHLRTFREDDTARPRAFGVHERAYPRRRLSKPGGDVYVRATAAADLDHASWWQLSCAFSRKGDDLSGIVWSIPPGSPPEELLRTYLEAARRGPFLHGSAGCGVISPIAVVAEQQSRATVEALMKRFVGLDVPDLATRLFATDGIECTNWLTFVADRLLERVGGRVKLRRKVGSTIVVHDTDHGVLIQAGPRPLSGDTHQPDELGPYREVAAALKPAFSWGDDDEPNPWRRRFFRGAKWP